MNSLFTPLFSVHRSAKAKGAMNDTDSGRSGSRRALRRNCERRTIRLHCEGETKDYAATSISPAPLETAGSMLVELERSKTQASSRSSERLISSACHDRSCVQS